MKIASRKLAVVQSTKLAWTAVLYTCAVGGNPKVTGRVMAYKKDFTFDQFRTKLVRDHGAQSVVKG